MKWTWKLETELETGNGRQTFTLLSGVSHGIESFHYTLKVERPTSTVIGTQSSKTC